MNGASLAAFRAAAEPEDWEPQRKGCPPRCGHCMRFVPLGTIEDFNDEERGWTMLGVCKTHGRVEVS